MRHVRFIAGRVATAVVLTGSLAAGRALFDVACQRPHPIPVFAEMSSLNPLFVLPGALRERAAQIAEMTQRGFDPWVQLLDEDAAGRRRGWWPAACRRGVWNINSLGGRRCAIRLGAVGM